MRPSAAFALALLTVAAGASGVSAQNAAAGWEPVDYFWTPARVTYCEMLRSGSAVRLGCTINADRDERGRTAEYLLDSSGRVRRTLIGGQGGVGFPSLAYDRWYSMQGGAVKAGKAPGAITCIVRRSSGLHCTNRSGHGFVLSKQRQRTF